MQEAKAPVTCKPVGNRNPRQLYVHRWVVGTDFNGLLAQLRIVDLRTGEVECGDFSKLGRYLEVELPTQTIRRITFDLHSLVRVDVAQYASAIGRPDMECSRQTAFELSRPRGRVVIPCQVLALALFGASPANRKRMLLPTGLGEARFRSYRATLVQAQKGTEERTLKWVREHLSARGSWASLYAAALVGTLDMTPPKAQVDAKFEGLRRGNDFFVTRMSIVTLRASDHVGSDAERAYEFRRPGTPRPSRKPPELFPELQGLACVSSGLTTSQWRATLPLLTTGNYPLKTPQKTRRRLNVALRKYGAPCSWTEAGAASGSEKEAASRLVRRLQRLKTWEQFVTVLRDVERRCT